MPGTFTSISIFPYDLNERGDAIQAWETVAGTETHAIEEAKEVATVMQAYSSCGGMESRLSARKPICMWSSDLGNGLFRLEVTPWLLRLRGIASH